MKAARALVAVVVLLAIGYGVLQWKVGSVSDEALIVEAVDEAARASQEGRPGGVLEHLSKSLVFNNEAVGFNRKSIADFVREQKPKVTLGERKVEIAPDGKTATMRTPVTLTVKILTFERPLTIDNVVIEFKKEDAMQYLVVPTRKWRIAKVTAPDFDPQSWASEAMGF
ncbi:MAG: hypothetical protein AMXMBFR81_05910 [Chthonomonas sp.]